MTSVFPRYWRFGSQREVKIANTKTEHSEDYHKSHRYGNPIYLQYGDKGYVFLNN
jgi:hypothetical protein